MLRVERSIFCHNDCIEIVDQLIEDGKLSSGEILDYVERISNLGRIPENTGYEKIFQLANKLRPYPPKLTLADVINFIFALEIGAEFLITIKVDKLQEFIKDHEEFLFQEYRNYRDLEIFDEASLVQWIQEYDLQDAKTITVVTHTNEKKELPEGAKVLDFAYRINPKLGNYCVQALVNNESVSLDYILQENDEINIIIDEEFGQPKEEWLKFVQTDKANHEIKKWFRHYYIRQGKALIANEFSTNYNLYGRTFQDVAILLRCKTPDELYENLGKGLIDISKIKDTLRIYVKSYANLISKEKSDLDNHIDNSIEGVSADEYKICLHCQPFPDDLSEIIGIINVRNDQTTLHIHREDCSQIKNVNPHQKRIINWSDNCQFFTVKLKIRMQDREGMLRHILNDFCTHGRCNVRTVTPVYNQSDDRVAVAVINYLVSSKEQLDFILLELKSKRDILQVQILQITPGEANYLDR
ncbi:MAG: TGS domain-containing protein [Crocosphaera sp.]